MWGTVLALTFAAAAVGCAGGAGDRTATASGDIPDNQAFVDYSPPAGTFSLKVPEGWARTETGKVARLDVERYEFWRDGREVVLTLSAPAGADNVDPWRTVSDSFRWA